MIRVKPKNASQAITALENTWKKILPGSPVEYNFLDDSFNELYKDDQQTSTLIFVFAIIAILISCLGLFGLAAFTAERRTKEIGIRKVLGATVTGIVELLTKRFFEACIDCYCYSIACCLVCHEQMAAGFCLSYKNQPVDVYYSRFICHLYCNNNYQLSGNKSCYR